MSPVIVYLHGFRSSPASVKAQQMLAAVAALPRAHRPVLHVPFLDQGPAASIAKLRAWIEAQVADPKRDLTLVGSSLGGFYATGLAERLGAKSVAINPAIRPWEDLRPWIGPQANLHTGAVFEVTSAHFHELRELAVARLSDPSRHWLLVQAGDDVLDYREAIAFYAGAWQTLEGGGDHTFQGFERQIPAILRFAGVSATPAVG